jgi:hypothetical protein
MIGRAARNIGGEVVMYADHVTESMQAAIDETNRRREVQVRYNQEHGIEPTTIVKEIHDINERLRAVAETSEGYGGTGAVRGVPRDLGSRSVEQVEALVARMEADMRAAARNLEFERAAVLRDEVQQIRLRVLEEDASADVARAAERAGQDAGRSAPRGAAGSRATSTRRPGQRAAPVAAPTLEVTTVTVLPATADEPDDTLAEPTAATAADWLPGIRDEHDDDGGWQARWLDRPTWDRTVTPNVIKRTGSRPPRRRR